MSTAEKTNTVNNESPKSLRVMLADDDNDDRELFKEAVKRTGYPVTLRFAENGVTTMEMLNDQNTVLPDILFLDLNMPMKNGHECLEEIRNNQKLKDIPIIIYSTSSNMAQIEETYIGGANLYVPKPDSFFDLVEVLKKVFLLNLNDLTKPARENFVFKLVDVK